MKFSIIVPVYDAEAYLSECIDSVLVQSCPDFELILVDDGSTDSSGGICDRYAGSDSRIRVIHGINRGVSYARNTGLDHMSGDWLIFLDADDALHPHALSCISDAISANEGVDLVQYGLVRDAFINMEIDENRPVSPCVNPVRYVRSGLYNVCAGGSAIRASIVKAYDIRFDDDMKLAEDQVFMFQLMDKCNLCMRLPQALYCYRRNPSSASNLPKTESMISTVRSLVKYRKDMPLAAEQFDNVMITFIYAIAQDRKCQESLVLELMEQTDVKSAGLSSVGVRMFFSISLISKRLAISIVRMLKKRDYV